MIGGTSSLSLFGDVFERVRADYVEKPDDSKLIESAGNQYPLGQRARRNRERALLRHSARDRRPRLGRQVSRAVSKMVCAALYRKGQ
jgi:hypothetical protein